MGTNGTTIALDTTITPKEARAILETLERVVGLGWQVGNMRGSLKEHPQVMSMWLARECAGRQMPGIKRIVTGLKKAQFSFSNELKGKSLPACADIIRRPDGIKHIFHIRDKKRGGKINDGEPCDIVSARGREVQFVDKYRQPLEAAGASVEDMAAENRQMDVKVRFPEVVFPLNIKNCGMTYLRSEKDHGIPADKAIPLSLSKLRSSWGIKQGESWSDCIARHEAAGTDPTMLWVFAVQRSLKDDMERFLAELRGKSQDFDRLLRWAFVLKLKYKNEMQNIVAYRIAQEYADAIGEMLGPPEFHVMSNWRADTLMHQGKHMYSRQPLVMPNGMRSGRGGDNNNFFHVDEFAPWEQLMQLMISDPAAAHAAIRRGEF